MTKKKQDAMIQRVNLASSITKEFVVKNRLTQNLFDTAVEFWRDDIELNSIMIENPKKQDDDSDVILSRFIMEGGSIWALNFLKYRKIVSVNLCGLQNFTYVTVRIDLPGAFRLNNDDIKQSVGVIDAFLVKISSSAEVTESEDIISKVSVPEKVERMK